MPLNSYEKLSYKLFGPIAENIVTDKMKSDLERAHMDLRGAAYLSYVWLTTIIVAIVSTILAIILFLILELDLWLIVVILMIPPIVTLLTYFILTGLPSGRAKARGKKIDLHLPYALNFIAAMSSASISSLRAGLSFPEKAILPPVFLRNE